MKLSVIMPIYNTPPDFLHAAVDSVLAQTFRDFEFLILNDSPENGALEEIVRSCRDPRIRVFRNARSLGIANAHNFLLEKAKGEYVALMDHDDISLPRRFERQVAHMDAHPEIGLSSVACRRFGRFLKSGVVRYPLTDEAIRAQLVFSIPILHPAAIVRRSVLMASGIRWDDSYVSVNDGKLYLDLASVTKFGNLPDVLYRYRMSRTMTSRLKREQIAAEITRFNRLFLARIGLDLAADEFAVFDEYVIRGRCRVRDRALLPRIEAVLSKLSAANRKAGFAVPELFDAFLARISRQRRMNALWHSVFR